MLPEQFSEENQTNAQPATLNEESTQEPWEHIETPSVNPVRNTQTSFKSSNAQPGTANEESTQEPIGSVKKPLSSTRKTKTSGKRPASKGINKEDDSLDQAVKVLKQVASQKSSVPSNEFDAFGQHVSSQLKCLPLQDAILLQEDIQKLITSVRLRCVQTQSSSDNETQATTGSVRDLQQDTEPSNSSGNEQYHSLHEVQKPEPRLMNFFKNWTGDDDDSYDFYLK